MPGDKRGPVRTHPPASRSSPGTMTVPRVRLSAHHPVERGHVSRWRQGRGVFRKARWPRSAPQSFGAAALLRLRSLASGPPGSTMSAAIACTGVSRSSPGPKVAGPYVAPVPDWARVRRRNQGIPRAAARSEVDPGARHDRLPVRLLGPPRVKHAPDPEARPQVADLQLRIDTLLGHAASTSIALGARTGRRRPQPYECLGGEGERFMGYSCGAVPHHLENSLRGRR
jgi:hypothetical protein